MEFVKTVGPLGMIFIMFSLGLNLSYKDFFEVLKKPRNLIIALICQMIMLPFIGIVINDSNPQIDVIVIDNATFPFTSLVA